MNGPWELPEGWRWQAFKDVATVASNLVSPADYPKHLHLAPNHIVPETGQYEGLATVEEDCVTSSKHLFKPGQIIYSKIRPYLRKAAIAKTEGLCSADMYPIETELDSRFLMWWMLSGEFTKLALKGRSVIPKINQRELKALPVPVPPLPEQQAIVETIERMLSIIANISSTLEASGNRAVASRRSIANKVADRGRLVPLEDLIQEGLRNGKSVKDGDGVSVLRLGALRGSVIDLLDSKCGAWGQVDPTPYLVQRGDFLVSRGNGTLSLVGRGGMVTADPPDIAFPDTMIRVRPDTSRLDPDYLRLIWDSDAVRLQIESSARTTAGIYKINQTMLKELKLPLPDLRQQVNAAEWGTRALTHMNHLTETLVSTRERSGALRRSILKAAFEGRLTTASDVSPDYGLQENIA